MDSRKIEAMFNQVLRLDNFARSSALRVNERVDEVLAVRGRLA